MLLLIALRGNIFLYQGEELGLPQAHVPFDRLVDPEAIANWPQTLGRDGARTPMPWTTAAPWGGFSTVEPWLPMDAAHLPMSVDAQAGDPAAMLAWTRTLLALRKATPALRHGDIALEGDGDLLRFERRSGNETLLCLFNLTDEALALPDIPDSEILASVGKLGEALSGMILRIV
jgi:alpha-glucosidase